MGASPRTLFCSAVCVSRTRGRPSIVDLPATCVHVPRNSFVIFFLSLLPAMIIMRRGTPPKKVVFKMRNQRSMPASWGTRMSVPGKQKSGSVVHAPSLW